MTNSRNSRFGRFAPTYNCTICGRRTRETGQEGGTGLCVQCFELAGWDNACNDDGKTPEQLGIVATRDQLLSEIKAKGGDVAKVVACNDYLFPNGMPNLDAPVTKKVPATATRYPGPYTVSDKAKALGFDGLRLHVGSGRYYLMAYAFDAGRAITREEVAEVLEGHNMEDAISGMMRYGFLV